ncbi:MAG: hypothetical protein NUV80_06160 [Candidatus Berkelbacteria bacterium]|nr:hypothetical protein [Candidatus Berkelbacteria bacterium]
MAQPLPPRKKFGANLKPINTRTTKPNKVSDPWLDRAREAFDTSTSFIDTNYRKVWEDSISHFQNKHMQGSKYYSDSYKYRSKMFRPKTRAAGRQLEAASAAAFFSQLDIMSHEPEDDRNPMSKAGAALRQELINYRLSRKGQIPWFQVCVGATQEVFVYGIVTSKQFWEFETKEVDVPLEGVMDESGQPAIAKQRVKIKDKPDIKLYPIENIRFDPAAEWTDVVNTSPYFIAMEPMRIGDVRLKMESGEWAKVEDAVLMAARNQSLDSTRTARAGEKEDETDPKFSKALSDFDIVWVHENLMRVKGEEYQYYTLGTVSKLTEPRPLKEVYLHSIRPFVVGTCMIQPHVSVPDAPAHLSKGLNKEANEIANSRLDNVKLALNKRYLVKRGKQVDLQSLVRNAPGSVTLVNDVQGDVFPLEFNDVTASSFAEQDRVNNDMDDLMGSFSQGSVQTNRKLNETVGGMAMLRNSSTAMTQYVIRVFTETWVEPVLNQLDALEQYYESDIDLLNLMGRRANIEKHGVTAITKDLLMVPSQIVVNVANSAMDPMIRLQAFNQSLNMYAKFRQIMPSDMDPEPIKSYIFGLLGFRDASQFSIDNENPQIASMQQMIQQLQTALESKMTEIQANNETKFAKIESDERIKTAELMSEEDIAEMEGMIDLMIAEMGKETEENKTVNVETTKRMASELKERVEKMKMKSKPRMMQ